MIPDFAANIRERPHKVSRHQVRAGQGGTTDLQSTLRHMKHMPSQAAESLNTQPTRSGPGAPGLAGLSHAMVSSQLTEATRRT